MAFSKQEVRTEKSDQIIPIAKNKPITESVAAAYMLPSLHELMQNDHTLSGTFSVEATKHGMGVRCDAVDEGVEATLNARLKISYPFSISVAFIPLGAYTDYVNYFSLSLNNTDTADYFSIAISGNNNAEITGYYDDSVATTRIVGPARSGFDNKLVIATITVDANGGTLNVNGVEYTDATAPEPSPAYASTALIAFGDITGVSRNPNAIFLGGVVWGRALDSSERTALANNFWQVLEDEEVFLPSAAGATISASDATARRGQTDYNFTLSGGDATAGTATISDGVNTDSITIATYNANGINTCTIPSTIAVLYDATAVLTFTDAVSGTPTAAVSFQPTALNSYIDLVSPLATDDGYSMYHYTGAGTPITGWQAEWVTLTSPSSKTITLNADSGMILSSASTVNETANFYMINASGVRSAADLVTFQFVSGGAGSTSLGLSLSIGL